jgi:hypothetical protein
MVILHLAASEELLIMNHTFTRNFFSCEKPSLWLFIVIDTFINGASYSMTLELINLSNTFPCRLSELRILAWNCKSSRSVVVGTSELESRNLRPQLEWGVISSRWRHWSRIKRQIVLNFQEVNLSWFKRAILSSGTSIAPYGWRLPIIWLLPLVLNSPFFRLLFGNHWKQKRPLKSGSEKAIIRSWNIHEIESHESRANQKVVDAILVSVTLPRNLAALVSAIIIVAVAWTSISKSQSNMRPICNAPVEREC